MKSLVSFVSLLAIGCAGPLVESGGFRVHEAYLNAAKEQVRPRASFDLKCAPEKLSLVVVGVGEYSRDFPEQMGVTGCSQQLVYVRAPSGVWILNSSSK